MEMEILEALPERMFESCVPEHRCKPFRSCHAFIEYCDGYEIFWSYSTPVAVLDYANGYFFTNNHDCTATTRQQVGKWCGISVAERRTMKASGAFCAVVH